MAISKFEKNNQANESISKYKLLSAYGGAGSLIHTQYGSVIISCIEEWGFLKRIIEFEKEALTIKKSDEEVFEYVIEQAKLPRNGNIGISNDVRFLHKLIDRKKFNKSNFRYLVIIPEIELNLVKNTIKDSKTELSIASTFMPKIFADKSHLYKEYKNWIKDWVINNPSDKYGENFFPPKKTWNELLIQDNLVLICPNGHISDFPWSRFLRWRNLDPLALTQGNPINLFDYNCCCNEPVLKISSSNANASGFDGKWLKCENCGKQTSLQGIMNVRIACKGHKPWEVNTGKAEFYSGNIEDRNSNFPSEHCDTQMRVALTTGNNLYFSRIMSSIYMPNNLFLSEQELLLINLRQELEIEKKKDNFEKCIEINKRIKEIIDASDKNEKEISDTEKEIQFRFQEFNAFTTKTESEINSEDRFLKIKDVTESLISLNHDFSTFFSRIVRIDNMKMTTTQLDFSRVQPIDIDSEDYVFKNIFRSNLEDVKAYPVVENYGEGVFFAFNNNSINKYSTANSDFIKQWSERLDNISYDSFSKSAINYAKQYNWQLYLVHTFSHLIMRELEFRCGYPTASLSERLYVSNDEKYKMYGCLIYTTEGAEGSMGGLIAQTKGNNLTSLIASAIKRATICHSDPLCFESVGQGLFDLNFASCFSCSLVSETSCELRNIYLDRRLLVDEDNGFFKDFI